MPTHPLGGIYLPARMGDLSLAANAPRPLKTPLQLSYSIATSLHAAAMGLSYTISSHNRLALLLYYHITASGTFAINGDSTIVSPDEVTYPLRPVVNRTLLGGPILQGYLQVVWSYSTLQWSEFAAIIKYYNPQSPQVTITYPDQSGAIVQRAAIMRPPVYGTQSTLTVSGVVLTFLIPRL